MHCDALTSEGVAQVTGEMLRTNGCLVQCFAAFVREGGFARFSQLADAFDALVLREGFAAVTPWARNLTDGQIRTLSGCGGVAGLNFCMDFLSEDGSREGQRAALLAHARRFIHVGGEDVLALGSDFDGIPPDSFIPDAAAMPRLLQLLADAFGSRVAEKIACGNFLRVFSEVCR